MGKQMIIRLSALIVVILIGAAGWFFLLAGPYQTDNMKKVDKQFDVVHDIYYQLGDGDSKDQFGSVNNGILSLKHMYNLQFDWDEIKPFEQKFKERDEHIRSIKAKQKELKADGVSDDKKTQLNNDIADLTKKVDQVSNDYQTAIVGIESIDLDDIDKDTLGLGYCVLISSYAPIISVNLIDTDQNDLIQGQKSNASDIRLKDLKYIEDDKTIGVDKMTGKQYISLLDDCYTGIQNWYELFTKNKGVDPKGDTFDLNLSDDQIQSLKDAIKDE